MSTALTEQSTTGGQHRPADEPTEDLPGRLDIADRVVEKIAAQAAQEVPHATGAPHRVMGVSVSDDPRAPQVSARVDGDVAIVSIHLAVTWPASVLDVTRQVRQRVVDRLDELVGITRAQVDIDVSALTAAPAQQRRVH